MKRRKMNVFSISFIDCITCGLGAIILLFVIVNARSAVHRNEVTKDLRGEVERWEKEVRMVINRGKKGEWCIATDIKKEDSKKILNRYSERFKIEKMFQDQKKSGFEIEETKIRKYDRYKRMLFCVYVSQGILMFIGEYIDGRNEEIKKNYQLHIEMISAFSG